MTPHPKTLPAKLVIYMQQKQLKLSAFLRSADPARYQQHSMVQTFASMPLGTIFNRTHVLFIKGSSTRAPRHISFKKQDNRNLL